MLSIITATYNDANLKESLISLKNQSLSENKYEIILVNDNPKNKLYVEKLIDRLSFSNLKLIHNEKNLGLTKSLNKALKYSKGEIIVRHDCDDISLPNRLEVIYNFFLNNKHIDIVSSYVFVKENSTKKKYIIPLKDKEIKNKLIFTNIIVHPSVAFRKNKIDEIGGYNEYFLYAQDYELYLRAIHNNLIFETIPKFLVEKSISENNITVKKRKQQLLYELAAKCLYFAKEFNYIKSVYSLSLTLYKFFIPNFLRKLRGKI